MAFLDHPTRRPVLGIDSINDVRHVEDLSR